MTLPPFCRVLPLLLACYRIADAQQQRDALILLAGNDTVSVERFVRTSERLEAELFVRNQAARLNFAATLGPGGRVSRLENQYRLGSADRAAPPVQSAVLTFTGDSVITEVTTGGQVATQRLGTVAGAVPFINPSFSLMELVLLRARALGGDSVSVPAFAVQGGGTLTFTVVRRGADSAVISVSGVPARLAVNANGEILGGVVPAQGLRIVRLRNAGERELAMARPDYSAPAGAPYTAEDVSIPAESGFSLAGTLTLPRDAKGPVPALVTISGSGLQDRDEAIPSVEGYALFREIADVLGRHGVAVLRVDDRGYGASGGDPMRATSLDFANDVRAALAFLRTRKDIDGTRLGLIGHSEGGIIAPMIAAESLELRGIVLLAGPSWKGRRVIEYQNRYALQVSPNMKPAQRDSLLRASMRTVDSMAAAQPWIRFYLDYDPLSSARRVRVPVLILQGATDRQVTAEQAHELAVAIRNGGNAEVTVRVFPNTNHLFLDDADGNPRGYGKLPVRLVRRDVLATLVEWVEKRFR